MVTWEGSLATCPETCRGRTFPQLAAGPGSPELPGEKPWSTTLHLHNHNKYVTVTLYNLTCDTAHTNIQYLHYIPCINTLSHTSQPFLFVDMFDNSWEKEGLLYLKVTALWHDRDLDQSGQTNSNMKSNGTTCTSCWSDPGRHWSSADRAVIAANSMRHNGVMRTFSDHNLTQPSQKPLPDLSAKQPQSAHLV